MDIATHDTSSPGIRYGESDESIRREFKAHLAQSAFPEDFAGIAIGQRPKSYRTYQILWRGISINPLKRDGLYVPCNLCGPKPKFKEGGILIRDELGHLYLIGPDCARDHFGDGFITNLNRFERDEERRATEQYVLQIIPRVGELIKFAEQLRPHVKSAQDAHAAFHNCPEIASVCRTAIARQDGWLTGLEERFVHDQGGRRRAESFRVNIAKIDGRAATQGRFTLGLKLDQVIGYLRFLGSSEDAALDTAVIFESAGELGKLRLGIQKSIREIRALLGKLIEFQKFFSKANFQSISAYCKDPRSPNGFDVSLRPNGYYVKPDNDFGVLVPIGNLSQAFPTIPESVNDILSY